MINKTQFWLLQSIIFIAFIAMTLPYPIIAPLFLSSNSVNTIHHLVPISGKIHVSLILGAYPLGLFMGTFLLGRLSDKCGKKNTLLFSLLLSACVQMGSGYLVTIKIYDGLLITRFLSGLFEGNIAIARAILAIVCQTEKKRKIHFGYANAALTLGWVVGPLLSIVFSNNHIVSFFDYSTPFYVASLLTLLIFLLTLFKFQEPQTIPFVSNTLELQIERPIKSLIEKKAIFLLICSLFMTLGVDAFYQFLPIYLSSAFNCAASAIGIAISLVAFTNAITNITLIRIIDKFTNTINSLILFPIILSLCFVILFYIHKSPLYVFLVLPLVGIFIALIMTNMSILISMKSSPLIQGRVMGSLLSQRSLGSAFISFIMAPLLTFNYRLPFLIGALFLFFSAFLIIFYKKMQQQKVFNLISEA